MRVLVAGGAGFIGNRLCEELLADGHHVVCVDNLVTGTNENVARFSNSAGFELRVERVDTVDDVEVDAIVHLASPASPTDFDRIPLDIIRANVLGTWRLLELARATDAMFLFASSSEAYGQAEVHPQREDYFGNVDPIGPRACYDESKRLGETLVATYVRSYGVCARIIRIFNTYGPRMRLDDGRVVPEFILAALRGEPLQLHAGGAQTRSFCFVDDLVRGIIPVALDRENAGEVFNLGNPEEITIRQLAETVIAIAESSSPLAAVDGRVQDPVRRRPDITKVSSRYGWRPSVALEDGISRTIRWFAEQPGVLSANSVRRA